MTTDKAYEVLQDRISYFENETAEVSSMALETLYEKAKDYDNMLVVAMEQQVAREESDILTF